MKISVVHVLTSFEVGGAETVAFDICRKLRDEQFEPQVCSLSGPGPMQDKFEQEGIATAWFSGGDGMPGPNWWLVWKLARFFREQAFEIVHCHNTKSKMYGAIAGGLVIVGASTVVVLSRR